MEDVDDPFSGEGEHIVYMRFYAAAQSALTDHLIGPESVSDRLIEEIIECAFYGLYDKIRAEPRANDAALEPEADHGRALLTFLHF